MKKAIIYIRVSTDEQADKGYSMRHQEEYLRKYCEMNSIQMLEVVKEDYSAKTFIRPAFNKLLVRLKTKKIKADFLVFTKWDRFSRNAPDAYAMISTLNRIGIEPQAVEQPLDLTIPENKIMLAFYLSAPEVENDRRALNTLVGMRRARKEGRWISSAPKGYDNQLDDRGKKVIVPNQYAPILRWAFETLSSGDYGVEDVRRMCLKKGFDFKKSQFYTYFKNPAYCGRIIIPAYKNEEEQIIKGQHEPIISEALFDRVQLALAGKRFKTNYKICAQEELPLRGYLNCPQCGRKLCGSASTGGSGIKHHYYHCKYPCRERVKAHEANSAFSDFIAKFRFKEGVHKIYDYIAENYFKSKNGGKNANVKAIELEIEKNKERLDKAQQMMLDGKMDMADYKDIKRNIEPKIDALLGQQLGFNQIEIEYKDYLKNALKAMHNLGQLFDKLDVSGKQDIIRSTLKENGVFSDGRVRTEKINDLVMLIAYGDGEFGGGKKRKGSKICSLSGIVPEQFDLSNFLADLQGLKTLIDHKI
jgi:site-specific DNA recombinase